MLKEPMKEKRWQSGHLLWIAIPLFFLSFITGCQSTAAPPAAPVEIPGFVTFPESLTIDISEIEAKTGSDPTTIGVVSGGDYSEIILEGADLINSINDFNVVILSLFEGISVPVSPETTTYERTLADNPDRNPLKIDFSDFDLDRDGVDEGCTGCTCPVGCDEECPDEASAGELRPVCYRVWSDDDDGVTGNFEPLLAGVLGRFPSGDNPGEGEYRARISSETESNTGVATTVGVVYDHLDDDDAAYKLTDVSLRQILTDQAGALLATSNIHGMTGQETIENDSDVEEVRKHVELDYEATDSSAAVLDYLDYVARFLEEGFFWRGTVDSASGYQFTNLCVDLRTGNEADADDLESPDGCGDLSVLGVTASPVTSSDVAFPTDFPEDPTF